MSEIEPGGGQPTIDEISEAWGVAIDMEGTPMAGSYLYELRQLERLQRAVAAVYFVYRDREDGPLQVATYPDPDLSGLDKDTVAEVVRALQSDGPETVPTYMRDSEL